MANITIPKKLNPIVQAFFAESPQAAKKLIMQAAQAIYGSEEEKCPYDIFSKPIRITNEHLEEICAFMQGLKPNDVLEAILSAQIVVTHMLGMRKLARGIVEDQRLGLKMLKFSGEAMGRLQKKRCGGVQNINIHYHGTKVETSSMSIPIHPMI